MLSMIQEKVVWSRSGNIEAYTLPSTDTGICPTVVGLVTGISSEFLIDIYVI